MRQNSIPLKDRTEEEKAAYRKEVRERFNNAHPEKFKRKYPREIEKPESYACRSCEVVKPYDELHFQPSLNGVWQLSRTCRECDKEKNLARKYGISREELKKLAQKTCAICGTKKRIVIDHCHDNGKVRDSLCNSCNIGLGLFKDNSDALRAAADYIDRHKLFG